MHCAATIQHVPGSPRERRQPNLGQSSPRVSRPRIHGLKWEIKTLYKETKPPKREEALPRSALSCAPLPHALCSWKRPIFRAAHPIFKCTLVTSSAKHCGTKASPQLQVSGYGHTTARGYPCWHLVQEEQQGYSCKWVTLDTPSISHSWSVLNLHSGGVGP